jgi:hypothetical protein
MASKKKSQNDNIQALLDLTTRHQTLLARFLENVTGPRSNSAASNQSDPDIQRPNPLEVLRDSAALLKAHTTKLSLLILNKPFSPASITGELKKAVEECVVCMMSALEIMEGPATEESSKDGAEYHAGGGAWGEMMIKEARMRVARVIREVSVLVGEVQAVSEGEIGTAKSKSSATSKTGRDTLSSTGVVWEACDMLVELSKLGTTGLAAQKAQQYRDMLTDAINELKEWAEEAEDDEDEAVEAETSDGDDEFEGMFGAANKLPKSNTALRNQLDASTKRLKTISLLYQALIKRRLKAFATLPDKGLRGRTEILDKLMTTLQAIPGTADDLASAFYDLDGPEASKLLAKCTELAASAARLVKQDWNDNDDEFTSWSDKWEAAISD